ncbi:MAG: MFS transporter [Pirellulales bacterium]|nr:MFS transporter [Pirellulales bacterium]
MPSQLTSADTSQRPTRVRLGVLAFLCVLSFLTYYDRQCIVRAQESIQTSLGITDDQMGIVFGMFWLAYAAFEIPGGWMGDRIGARFTLTRIVFAWSLFTALTGVAAGFYTLLLYRFLFGVGEAGAYPNMARVTSRWLPAQERARASGLLWLTARFGAAFAPLIFGAITRSIGNFQTTLGQSSFATWFSSVPAWRIGFLVSGAIGIIWCLAFYPWFRDEPAEKSSANEAERVYIETGRGSNGTGHQISANTWARLFSSPSLWAMALYYVTGSFGWSFYVSWMPRYLKEVQGVAFEKSEWSSAYPFLCGGLACLVGGIVSDLLVNCTGRRRLGRAICPVAGCLVAAAAMLAMPYARTAGSATLLMCVASFAFDFGQAANIASVIDIGGRNAGIAMGFINTVGCIGNAVQPYVGAVIFRVFGWNVLFVVYAAAFLLASTSWAIINPTRTFYDESHLDSNAK